MAEPNYRVKYIPYNVPESCKEYVEGVPTYLPCEIGNPLASTVYITEGDCAGTELRADPDGTCIDQ